MIYKAPYLDASPSLAASWDAAPWSGVQPLFVRCHMGDTPGHFPKVEARLAYDEEALYLMWQVADRFVLARAGQDQEAVFKDSCVEFFFTPGTDLSLGYFNLEMNCGGTILFHFQKEPRKDSVVLSETDCRAVERVHSLPKIVDPEIREAVTWTLACRIPLSVIARHCPVVRPEPGAVWQANFFKCADGSSHPHWLTWARVPSPTPDFHRPEAFGRIIFS